MTFCGHKAAANPQRREARLLARLPGPSGTVVAFSPDGKRILTVGGDEARVWDAETFKPVTSALRHGKGQELVAAAFSGKGDKVFTAGGDQAQLWDAAGDNRPLIFRHGARVRSASMSPDGAKVLTAGDDSVVGVWDGKTGRRVAQRRHPRPVRFAAWSPDGKRVLSIAAESVDAPQEWEGKPSGAAAYLWDSATGADVVRAWAVDNLWAWEEIPGQSRTRWPQAAAFNSDGGRVATTLEGKVSVRDTNRGVVQFTTDSNEAYGGAGGVAFSLDGSLLTVVGGGIGNRELVDVRDAGTGKQLRLMAGSYRAPDARFSRDGRHLYLGALRDLKSTPAAHGPGVWDVATGEQILTIPGKDRDDVPALAASPDGRRLVLAYPGEQEATVWEVPVNKE
jgi:WD40 repeat protein